MPNSSNATLTALEAFRNQWMADNDLSSPKEVNAGLCEDFALALVGQIPRAEVVYTENYVDWEADDYPGGHAWVEVDGKCIDAECLQGVERWQELPFFERRLTPAPAKARSMRMG